MHLDGLIEEGGGHVHVMGGEEHVPQAPKRGSRGKGSTEGGKEGGKEGGREGGRGDILASLPVSNTSSAAPLMVPFVSACTRSSSTMRGPLPMLMTTRLGLALASS